MRAALLVRGGGLTFQAPLDGRLAVNDVRIRFQRNVAHGDVVVVDDLKLSLTR